MPKLNRAGALIFDPDLKHILLIQGKLSQKWGPPKGHLEDSDINILMGGLREVEEETGIRVKFPDTNDQSREAQEEPKRRSTQSLLQQLPYVSTTCQTRLYLLVIPYNYPFAIQDANEIQDIRWWPLDQLPMDDPEATTRILKTVCSPTRLENTLKRVRANMCNYQLVWTAKPDDGEQVHKVPLQLNMALSQKARHYREARKELLDHLSIYTPSNQFQHKQDDRKLGQKKDWLKKFDQLKLDDEDSLLPEYLNTTSTNE